MAWRQEQIQALEQQTTQDFVAGMEQYILSIHLPALSPRMRTRLLTHDLRALIAWLRQFEQPDFESILKNITLPCLLYAGENDSCYALAQRAAQAIPNATFVPIPNGEHLEGGTWVNVLAPHIKELVESVASP